ncbi:ABC transporter ATP-binding protein [Streptomyces sp. NPDC087851]|uniref:ABC transporter ATP-binding protein n=1 Tax=Streptomyces sp. NPDC087851 TaxID=3365810 RepID=UPI003802EF5D
MTPVLEAEKLGKRYGKHQALTDCDLSIPQGRVIGLVGPNAAGKSTLLHLACGLVQPTSGLVRVLGSRPAANAKHLAKVGFVAQNTPVYAELSVADHLRMGAALNPRWDAPLARRCIERTGLEPKQKAGGLSGGQRAQLALTLTVAKRPELLIFDEPAAALDPLARRGFLENLMEFVGDLGASAALSSHALSDVERACDYLIALAGSRIQVVGDVADLLAEHHRIVGSWDDLATMPAGIEVIRSEPTGHESSARGESSAGHESSARRESSAVVRATGPLPAHAPWAVEILDLEELVLVYLTRATLTDAVSASTAQETHR